MRSFVFGFMTGLVLAVGFYLTILQPTEPVKLSATPSPMQVAITEPASSPAYFSPSMEMVSGLDEWEKAVRAAFRVSKEAGETIFPGYQFHELAIILVDRTTKKAVAVTADAREDAAHFLTQLPMGFSIRSDLNWKGKRAYAFEISPSLKSHLVNFIVHEVGHMEQSRWQRPIPLIEKDPRPTAEVLSLMLLEQASLREALKAPDTANRQERLLDLATIRSAILPSWNKDGHQSLEYDATEWAEGGAEYIGLSYALKAGSIDENGFLAGIEENFTDKDINTDYQSVIRARTYGLGAGLGMLFDRQGVNWKNDLRTGSTYSRLLIRNFPPDPNRLPGIKERLGFDKLSTDAEAVISRGEERKKILLSQWQGSSEPKITLRYTTGDDQKALATMGRNLKINDTETISEMTSFVIENQSIILKVTDRLIYERGTYPKSELAFHDVIRQLVVDGKTLSKDGSYRFKQVRLETRQTTLEARRPGRITLHKGAIQINID